MKARHPGHRCGPASGFSLVEVVMALGVISFCILSLLGLLAVGVQTGAASDSETAVTGILTAIVGDLGAAPRNVPASARISPRFKVPLGTAATHVLFFRADGALAGSVDAYGSGAVYRAALFVQPPAGAAGATQVRVLLTWPVAQADQAAGAPTKFQGSVETVAAFLLP